MRARILLRDDRPDDVEYLRRALDVRADDWGLEVESSWERTWERLLSEPFDMLVMDIDFRQADGAALLRRIRQDDDLSRLPVIAVLDGNDLISKAQAFDLEATDWLAKPIDEHDFVFRARNVLKLHRCTRRLASLHDELEFVIDQFGRQAASGLDAAALADLCSTLLEPLRRAGNLASDLDRRPEEVSR